MNINMLLVTVGMVLATFMTRAALLLAGRRFKLSPRVEAGLRYAPVCALAVLIVPEVVVQAGSVNLSFANPRLVAALAATAFFLWKRSMVGCIVVGTVIVVAFRML
ncbi:MAG TPA: AzlD domain-containing protein, partial [Steroidobacteraceae bacterium]|jgi:branched-subunit amino acid transport protein|nr:AzlD domain-containing protein [Steroidobacteraceae bacterium]